MPSKLTNEGLRKAAILVASLDTSAADAVLDQLTPDQARQVREIVVELETIDESEQRRVIDEFFHVDSPDGKGDSPLALSRGSVAQRGTVPFSDGVELDGRLAWLASRKSELIEQEPPRLPTGPRFQFLQETEADKLVTALANERPQTIALVLSHLAPARAGSVLGRLPENVQVEVVRRLVDLEEADPAILHEVEEALRGRLSRPSCAADPVEFQRRRVAGLSAVAGILKATDGRMGLRILDNLANHDRTLADKLLPRPLAFDDLPDLEADVLSETLDEAGLELLLPALLGAHPELAERLLSLLPAADAGALRYQLDHPEPIRLRDVEEARKQIARIASRVSFQVRS